MVFGPTTRISFRKDVSSHLPRTCIGDAREARVRRPFTNYRFDSVPSGATQEGMSRKNATEREGVQRAYEQNYINESMPYVCIQPVSNTSARYVRYVRFKCTQDTRHSICTYILLMDKDTVLRSPIRYLGESSRTQCGEESPCSGKGEVCTQLLQPHSRAPVHLGRSMWSHVYAYILK